MAYIKKNKEGILLCLDWNYQDETSWIFFDTEQKLDNYLNLIKFEGFFYVL